VTEGSYTPTKLCSNFSSVCPFNPFNPARSFDHVPPFSWEIQGKLDSWPKNCSNNCAPPAAGGWCGQRRRGGPAIIYAQTYLGGFRVVEQGSSAPVIKIASAFSPKAQSQSVFYKRAEIKSAPPPGFSIVAPPKALDFNLCMCAGGGGGDFND